jgi:hypothetical protein
MNMNAILARSPYIAGVVGSGSLIVGLYSFVSPLSAIRVYGSRPLADPDSKKSDNSSPSEPLIIEWTRTLTYAHGVRNTAMGLAIVSLCGFYHIEPSPVAANAVKRCLGVLVLVGSMIPFGDSVVTARYMAAQQLAQTDRETAKKASAAHASRSVFWLAAGLMCLLG